MELTKICFTSMWGESFSFLVFKTSPVYRQDKISPGFGVLSIQFICY